MLDSLVLRWGYLAVGIGTMLEGETVLLAASQTEFAVRKSPAG